MAEEEEEKGRTATRHNPRWTRWTRESAGYGRGRLRGCGHRRAQLSGEVLSLCQSRAELGASATRPRQWLSAYEPVLLSAR